MSKALVIGGSSGLGLALARKLRTQFETVVITSRKYDQWFEKESLICYSLPLNEGVELAGLQLQMREFDLVVYAAGFYQEGFIQELRDSQIIEMIDVGLLAPCLILKQILRVQRLPCFVAITSTSQWTPRQLEPVYTAVKAGLGMLAHSVSLDERVGKVLVAAPSGMDTGFWAKTEKDVTGMLPPEWVADQIIQHLGENYRYRFIKILGGPSRVEISENETGEKPVTKRLMLQRV